MPIDMTEIEELAKRLRASNWWVQDYSSNEQLRREAADTIDSLLAEIKRGREEIAKLRGVVSASATQFEFYVEQHLAKSPPDTAKAVVNKAHAEQCRAALEGKDNVR